MYSDKGQCLMIFQPTRVFGLKGLMRVQTWLPFKIWWNSLRLRGNRKVMCVWWRESGEQTVWELSTNYRRGCSKSTLHLGHSPGMGGESLEGLSEKRWLMLGVRIHGFWKNFTWKLWIKHKFLFSKSSTHISIVTQALNFSWTIKMRICFN